MEIIGVDGKYAKTYIYKVPHRYNCTAKPSKAGLPIQKKS